MKPEVKFVVELLVCFWELRPQTDDKGEPILRTDWIEAEQEVLDQATKIAHKVIKAKFAGIS